MSPPRHISYSSLLPTTRRQNPQKPTITTGHHVSTSPYIAFSTTTYHRFTGQHVVKTIKKHTITTGHHVPTSPYTSFSTITHYRSTGQHVVKILRIIPLLQVTMSPPRHMLLSTTTYYRSTGQHVVKTLRSIPLLQVTMSPPRHISHSLLLPTTGLQVNTSSKPSESYHYYRSPCPHLTISHSLLSPTTGLQVNTSSKPSEAYHNYRSPCPHLAIFLILYYYPLQVYRSTRRQNTQNHAITTGHHVPTSPYLEDMVTCSNGMIQRVLTTCGPVDL